MKTCGDCGVRWRLLPILLLSACAAVPSSTVPVVPEIWCLYSSQGKLGSGVPVSCRPSGSGYLVSFLTVGHLVDDLDATLWTAYREDGDLIEGGVERAVHSSLDAAVVSFFSHYPIPTVRIDAREPVVGERVTVLGYGGGRRELWIAGGRISARTRATAPITFGDSGGAIVDSDGELLGIVLGVASQVTPLGRAFLPHHGHFLPVVDLLGWLDRAHDDLAVLGEL